jgi:hypothetical protein
VRSLAAWSTAHLARGCREWAAIALFTSLRPRRCRFISRDSNALHIPNMRSNHMSEGSNGLRCVPLAARLALHPCQVPCHQ